MEIASQPISVEEFLYMSGLRFLDDPSINRKPSMSARPSLAKTPVTLEDKLDVGARTMVERELIGIGCEMLKKTLADFSGGIEKSEAIMNERNPKVFVDIRTDEEDGNVIKVPLQTYDQLNRSRIN
jgi:hypothetical protein